MALETLKGVTHIGGYGVCAMDAGEDAMGDAEGFVRVDHEGGAIRFQIQTAPIKEVGVNGCQLDTLIHTAKHMLDTLNRKFHSPFNDAASEHLYQALKQLTLRTTDREERGVEGFSKQ